MAHCSSPSLAPNQGPQGPEYPLPGPGDLLAIHQPLEVDDLDTLKQCLLNVPTQPDCRIPMPTLKAVQEYLANRPPRNVPRPNMAGVKPEPHDFHSVILGYHHTTMVRRVLCDEIEKLLKQLSTGRESARLRSAMSEALAQLNEEIHDLYRLISLCEKNVKARAQDMLQGRNPTRFVEVFNAKMDCFTRGWREVTELHPQVHRLNLFHARDGSRCPELWFLDPLKPTVNANVGGRQN